MKLGIFLSRCEGMVGTAIDLETLAEAYAADHTVRICDSFYYKDDFDTLLNVVDENKLDALVLGGESPLMYQKVRNGDFILKRLSKKGVNTNRISMVNLKNMVAMPHEATQEELQQKAKLLLDVGIEKVRQSGMIKMVEIAPRKAVAVVGANIGSIAVSQHFLDEGYKVFLIHDGDKIELPAEHAGQIHPTFVYVTSHPRFREIRNSVVSDLYGFPGDYMLELNTNGHSKELAVGAAVLSFENKRKMIKEYRSVFHLDIGEHGAIAPLHNVTARSRTSDRGVFIIDYEKSDEADAGRQLLSADATAGMVINLLNRKEIFHRITVSQVSEKLCSGCGACVKTCIFKAVSLRGNPPISVIDPKRCRGCGNCVAACPSEARDLVAHPSRYMFKAVDILSTFQPENKAPKMLVLACEGCGYPCLDEAAEAGYVWPVGIMPLKVVCGGQIDTQLIMHAFVMGFDHVTAIVCPEGACHHAIGNTELERRTNLFKEILKSRGMDPGIISIVPAAQGQSECVNRISKIYSEIH